MLLCCFSANLNSKFLQNRAITLLQKHNNEEGYISDRVYCFRSMCILSATTILYRINYYSVFGYLTGILALMPLALGFGLGAQMQQPLAIAVIGGFVVGLPMLLIVLPSLMLFIYKREVV